MAGRLARGAILAVAAATLAGCNGYMPVRWPTSDLWTPQVMSEPAVQLPTLNLDAYPIHLERQQVTVAVEPLNESSTMTVCGLDLHAHHIQPLLFFVENHSDQAYQISTHHFSVPVIPASRVARYGQAHIITTTANYLRWLLWLGPGMVFSAIIEPLTALDFPGVHELAARPGWPHNRQVAETFVSHELRDTVLQPGQSMQGLWFVKTVPPGTTLTLTVPSTTAGDSLTFTFTMPLDAGAIPTQTYAEAYPKVWNTVMHVVQHTPGWRVLEHDQAQGRLLIRKGVWPLRQTMATLQVDVRKTTETSTEVAVARVGATQTLTAPGSIRSVGVFFQHLDAQLKPFVPVIPDRVTGSPSPASASAY